MSLVKLLFIDENYAEKIERFGRTSTAIEPKENDTPEAFTERIAKRGHLSVARCCNASFEIICSRVCQNQIVRHPHLNFVVESQRYVKFNRDFIIPDSIKANKELCLFYENTLQGLKDSYNMLLKSGIPKEDCRMLLPNACETKVCLSGNFQAISDFCCLRNQKEAQWEIQEIAREIFEIMAKEAPAYFEYFRGKNGYCKRKVWE